MWFLVFLGAIVFGLICFRMVRTMWVLGVFVWTCLLMGLAFVVGGILSFMFFPESVREWHIAKSWVTMIADSDVGMWAWPFIPIVFVFDCLKWVLQITIFQGNVFLWVFEIIAVWKSWEFAENSWKVWHERVREQQALNDTIDPPITGTRYEPPPAKRESMQDVIKRTRADYQRI